MYRFINERWSLVEVKVIEKAVWLNWIFYQRVLQLRFICII